MSRLRYDQQSDDSGGVDGPKAIMLAAGDVERAFACERLKELLDVTWEELAQRLGLSLRRIHQIRTTKNRLAPAVQADVAQRKLTERQARRLVLLPPPVQETVAAAIKEHALTHQQSEAVIHPGRRWSARGAVGGPGYYVEGR